jgi:hypothetical protein
LCCRIAYRCFYRFAQYSLAKVAASHIESGATAAAATRSGSNQRSARARRLTGPGHGSKYYARRGIYQSRGDSHYCFSLARSNAADSELGSIASESAAANVSVLIIAAKLRDAADDDGVTPESG